MLVDEHLSLAEVFAQHGYKTAGFVATPHLAAEFNYGQGFDRYEDFASRNKLYVDAGIVAQALLDDLLQRTEAEDFPFFVYAHFQEPHPPWRHGSPWLKEPELSSSFFNKSCAYVPTSEEVASLSDEKKHKLIAKYDGAIRATDDWIGVILNTLRTKGILENTILAISTDHGIELMDRYSATHGYTQFDEVVKSFLVLFDSGRVALPASTESLQGRIFDIGPTLMAMTGIEVPESFDGVDLLGNATSLPPFAFTTCDSGEVVRSGDYKLHSISFPEYKNRPPGLEDGYMLFDVAQDPGETVDVKQEHPEQFEKMKQALERYRKELATEFFPSARKEDKELRPSRD